MKVVVSTLKGLVLVEREMERNVRNTGWADEQIDWKANGQNSQRLYLLLNHLYNNREDKKEDRFLVGECTWNKRDQVAERDI